MEGTGGGFVQLRFFVQEASIGRLVGKQGCNISAIRDVTKVRVNMASDDRPNPQGDTPEGFREVTVTGQQNPVQIAAQLLMSFGLADRSTAEGSVYAKPCELAVYLEHEPPPEAWSDVAVKDQLPSPAGGTIVVLEGMPHALMRAVTGVGFSSSAPDWGEESAAPAAAAAPKKVAPPAKPAAAAAPPVPETTETVPLHRTTIGRVIGKGGSGLKQIREASSCTLEVSSDQGVATVSGSLVNVATAKCLLHMKAAEPYPSVQEQGTTVFEFYVPQGLAGWVIGKGGETLKACRQQFQASVQVLPQGTAVDPSYRPIPAHVRFVSVSAATADSVRNCLDFLVDSLHAALTSQQQKKGK